MNIDALNADFGMNGTLRFVEGRGGLVMMEIENALATATITLHGGQVLSYRPRGTAEDLLFVSERAYFAPGQEIKGGVPICWPWFGRDPEGQGRVIHGFARALPWSVLACEARPDGATWVRLGLADDDRTRALWPHPFKLRVEIEVGATLSVTLIAAIPVDVPYRITQGLHAYFKIGDPTRLGGRRASKAAAISTRRWARVTRSSSSKVR